MSLAIDVQHLSFHYPKQTDVLVDVSFQLKDHDFAGMIGPNGGGKSTLLKIILGLLAPSQGTVTIYGESPTKARRNFGYVPQFAKFPRDFPITVRDAVALAELHEKNFWGLGVLKHKDRLHEVLTDLKLIHLQHRPIQELSGGQLQRLLLARALLPHPKILVLDEPTASVDPGNEFDIMEYLKKLSQNMAILIVSHDVGMISTYVKSVICLNHQLSCHSIENLTPELLRNLYQSPVDIIHHHSHSKTC